MEGMRYVFLAENELYLQDFESLLCLVNSHHKTIIHEEVFVFSSGNLHIVTLTI